MQEVSFSEAGVGKYRIDKPVVQAGIIGGAGYTGGELLRLLLNHPRVALNLVHSRSHAGSKISDVHPDLLGDTDLVFSNTPGFGNSELDVVFLCLGHGESARFLAEAEIPDEVVIIDLSHDFRLQPQSQIKNRAFVYGLPELNKEQIRSAQSIANPGCFATAIQLGLLPLAGHSSLADVYTTGITGSTGAGQSLTASSHFSWRANNIQSYKTLTHQHVNEIQQSLLQAGADSVQLNFVPWRGDFTRGIFISSMLNCELSLEELLMLYRQFYKDAAFTFLSENEIFLKQVVNTNKCVIRLEKVGSKLVVHSIIDNLLKGASGQAVQNMNLVFGFEETAGLKLKSTGF